MEGDSGAEPAAGNDPVDLIPDAGLQDVQFVGQIDRNLALLAIHRTKFDVDLETVAGAFAPAITGH